MSDDPFLSRWSRLKRAAKVAPGSPEAAPNAQARPIAPVAVPASPPAVQARADPEGEPAALPPVQSLTAESDFSPFMGAKVDESLRRRALKTLFQDPRFNVMDGLDTYTDDYSKPDPLPEGWLEKMTQMAGLGDQGRADDDLGQGRRAAVEQPAAGTKAGDSPGEGRPATPGEPPSSDTSASDDSAPPMEESRREDDRLA